MSRDLIFELKIFFGGFLWWMGFITLSYFGYWWQFLAVSMTIALLAAVYEEIDAKRRPWFYSKRMPFMFNLGCVAIMPLLWIVGLINFPESIGNWKASPKPRWKTFAHGAAFEASKIDHQSKLFELMRPFDRNVEEWDQAKHLNQPYFSNEEELRLYDEVLVLFGRLKKEYKIDYYTIAHQMEYWTFVFRDEEVGYIYLEPIYYNLKEMLARVKKEFPEK